MPDKQVSNAKPDAPGPDANATSDGEGGLKVALSYAAVSVLMIAMAVALYVTYVQRQIEMRNADKVFSQELSILLEKTDAVRQAQVALGDLRVQFEKITMPEGEKEKVYGAIWRVDEGLVRAQTLIDRAESAIRIYLRLRNSELSSSTGIIGTAHAQPQGIASPEVKIGFAIVAFALMVALMAYCLWMIARPAVTASDKKWAKDLLNKELVFLGGIIGGIVMK